MIDDSVDCVSTATGGVFHFMNPDPDEVFLEDIIHNLARLPRWNGATTEPITVAQHSVMVARMLRYNGYSYEIQMQGLMHDAAEAYLGDFPRPLKHHLPDLQAIELLVEAAIFERFSISFPLDPVVKMMDKEAYRWEYRDLMRGDRIAPPLGHRSPLRVWETDWAEEQFETEFWDLDNARADDKICEMLAGSVPA